MSLYIATPIDGGDVWSTRITLGYSERLRQVSLHLRETVEVAPGVLFFSTDIVKARNRVVARVLQNHPEADPVLWWDDDVIVYEEPCALITRLLEIMRTGRVHVLAVPYTSKRRPVRWVHQATSETESSELLTAQLVGFGFTLTSRACLQALADDAEIEEDCLTDGTVMEVPDVFQLRKVQGAKRRKRLSEDYSFCESWRARGGEIHVYNGPGNMLGHAGSYVYDARDMR